MPPKKARSEKNQPKISFFTTSEKENSWSEDETDTGTTTEANEPIEVDDDVSHEASENKEQGKFQSRWASLYTWLTYDKDKNKMYSSKCISKQYSWQLFIASRIAQNCLNCRKSFSNRGPPYPGLMAHYFWWWWAESSSSSKARVISVESSKF